MLANRRAIYLAPTHALAAEMVKELKAHARTLPLTSVFTHDRLEARVRHHQGRARLRINDEHGARAKRMEAI